jgi:hypothetical protein
MAAPAISAVNGTIPRILFLMRTSPLVFVFAPPVSRGSGVGAQALCQRPRAT